MMSSECSDVLVAGFETPIYSFSSIEAVVSKSSVYNNFPMKNDSRSLQYSEDRNIKISSQSSKNNTITNNISNFSPEMQQTSDQLISKDEQSCSEGSPDGYPLWQQGSSSADDISRDSPLSFKGQLYSEAQHRSGLIYSENGSSTGCCPSKDSLSNSNPYPIPPYPTPPYGTMTPIGNHGGSSLSNGSSVGSTSSNYLGTSSYPTPSTPSSGYTNPNTPCSNYPNPTTPSSYPNPTTPSSYPNPTTPSYPNPTTPSSYPNPTTPSSYPNPMTPSYPNPGTPSSSYANPSTPSYPNPTTPGSSYPNPTTPNSSYVNTVTLSSNFGKANAPNSNPEYSTPNALCINPEISSSGYLNPINTNLDQYKLDVQNTLSDNKFSASSVCSNVPSLCNADTSQSTSHLFRNDSNPNYSSQPQQLDSNSNSNSIHGWKPGSNTFSSNKNLDYMGMGLEHIEDRNYSSHRTLSKNHNLSQLSTSTLSPRSKSDIHMFGKEHGMNYSNAPADMHLSDEKNSKFYNGRPLSNSNSSLINGRSMGVDPNHPLLGNLNSIQGNEKSYESNLSTSSKYSMLSDLPGNSYRGSENNPFMPPNLSPDVPNEVDTNNKSGYIHFDRSSLPYPDPLMQDIDAALSSQKLGKLMDQLINENSFNSSLMHRMAMESAKHNIDMPHMPPNFKSDMMYNADLLNSKLARNNGDIPDLYFQPERYLSQSPSKKMENLLDIHSQYRFDNMPPHMRGVLPPAPYGIPYEQNFPNLSLLKGENSLNSPYTLGDMNSNTHWTSGIDTQSIRDESINSKNVNKISDFPSKHGKISEEQLNDESKFQSINRNIESYQSLLTPMESKKLQSACPEPKPSDYPANILDPCLNSYIKDEQSDIKPNDQQKFQLEEEFYSNISQEQSKLMQRPLTEQAPPTDLYFQITPDTYYNQKITYLPEGTSINIDKRKLDCLCLLCRNYGDTVKKMGGVNNVNNHISSIGRGRAGWFTKPSRYKLNTKVSPMERPFNDFHLHKNKVSIAESVSSTISSVISNAVQGCNSNERFHMEHDGADDSEKLNQCFKLDNRLQEDKSDENNLKSPLPRSVQLEEKKIIDTSQLYQINHIENKDANLNVYNKQENLTRVVLESIPEDPSIPNGPLIPNDTSIPNDPLISNDSLNPKDSIIPNNPLIPNDSLIPKDSLIANDSSIPNGPSIPPNDPLIPNDPSISNANNSNSDKINEIFLANSQTSLSNIPLPLSPSHDYGSSCKTDVLEKKTIDLKDEKPLDANVVQVKIPINTEPSSSNSTIPCVEDESKPTRETNKHMSDISSHDSHMEDLTAISNTVTETNDNSCLDDRSKSCESSQPAIDDADVLYSFDEVSNSPVAASLKPKKVKNKCEAVYQSEISCDPQSTSIKLKIKLATPVNILQRSPSYSYTAYSFSSKSKCSSKKHSKVSISDETNLKRVKHKKRKKDPEDCLKPKLKVKKRKKGGRESEDGSDEECVNLINIGMSDADLQLRNSVKFMVGRESPSKISSEEQSPFASKMPPEVLKMIFKHSIGKENCIPTLPRYVY